VDKVERWLGGRLKNIRGFIDGGYEHDLHAERVDALAGATLGVMTSASLAVAVIGQALARGRGLVTKHAIKQVDQLLSNRNIDAWDAFARRVPQRTTCFHAPPSMAPVESQVRGLQTMTVSVSSKLAETQALLMTTVDRCAASRI